MEGQTVVVVGLTTTLGHPQDSVTASMGPRRPGLAGFRWW